MSLRAWTFLSPGIPMEFYRFLTQELSESLERPIELHAEPRLSGPMRGDPDPFAQGQADLAFLCSPSYLHLSALENPSVSLVPVGFVFDDERVGREPVYFSDVVVRRDHPARRFVDLEGGVWGYNDVCSLSGHVCVLQALSELGCGEGFFGRREPTGSHHASIEAVLAGKIDAAAIDSNVLAIQLRERPELATRLRTLESWGPFPIQPIVLRRELAGELEEPVARALLELSERLTAQRSGGPSTPLARLSAFGLRACVPTDDDAYAEERDALCRLGLILC